MRCGVCQSYFDMLWPLSNMKASLFENLVRAELATDRYQDDVTTSLLPATDPARAHICTRTSGVFCGEELVQAFGNIHPELLSFCALASDGKSLEPGEPLVRIEGDPRLILSVERTLLNFLSLTCGTASLTRRYVTAIGKYPTRILATRKTIPGLRDLQLMAIRAGGGFVHRRSLSDGILIKDNHVHRAEIETLLSQARRVRSPLHRIEIEVQSLEELRIALNNAPDIVMLDNFDDAMVKNAIELVSGRCEIEVSGGISLERVPTLAALGVQYISVGALTHSAPALNLALDFVDA